MAIELEETVMRQIGLGNHYSWFNGSGSCRYLRDAAIEALPTVAATHNLDIAPSWLAHCRKASQVDQFGGGNYRLTNVWIACSYAIQDAVYRLSGDAGFEPEERWYFRNEDERRRWIERDQHRTLPLRGRGGVRLWTTAEA